MGYQPKHKMRNLKLLEENTGDYLHDLKGDKKILNHKKY